MAEPPHSPRICLHIGAHRTGTTSLQTALHRQRGALSRQGIGYWGPFAMRNGRWPGMFMQLGPTPLPPALQQKVDAVVADNTPLLARRLGWQRDQGHGQIILSEENILGTIGQNISSARLYGGASARLALFARVFGGHIGRVCLTIRRYDAYWRSMLAYWMGERKLPPQSATLRALARQQRRWPDVLQDVRRAFPGADIRVMAFEDWAGRENAHIKALVGAPLALPGLDIAAQNRAPDDAALAVLLGASPWPGGGQPFTAKEIAHLRAVYADDLATLKAGHLPGIRLLHPGQTL